MKKRRELDALVGGAKSRRKTSKSGHELLRYNGSESSDCDDFIVSSSKTRGTGLCSTCTSVLTFLLLVACMLVCAGLTWMHVEMRKDLETMRHGLQAVESRSAVSTEDVQKLYIQMANTNKSLDMDSKTLNQVLANITSINNTISKLSETVDKLSNGLKAAPELKHLPGKLQAVSQTLAAMGSDVSSMKDTVTAVSPFMKTTNTKLNDLAKQMEDLKVAPESNGPSSSNDLSPDLANLIQTFPQKLEDINTTVSSQISVMMKSLSRYEERFVQLDNITQRLTKNITTILSDHTTISTDHSSMATDYMSDEFKSSVTEIVHNMLSNMSDNVTSSGSPVSSHIETVVANITALVGTLEKKYDDLAEKAESSPGDTSDGAVSTDKLHTLETRLQELNETALNLKSDVKHMGSVLVTQSNQLTNVTHQVTGLTNYVSHLEQSLQEELSGKSSKIPLPDAPIKIITTTESGVVDKNEEKVTTKPENSNKEELIAETPVPEAGQPDIKKGSTNKPMAPDLSIGSTKSAGVQPLLTSTPVPLPNNPAIVIKNTTNDNDTESGSVQPPLTTKTVTLPHNPAIVITNITNADDLDLNFQRWDRLGTGQVSYDVLPGFLGPNTPPKEELKKFDEDHNDFYSLQEFANALGFTLSSTNENTDDDSEPPR